MARQPVWSRAEWAVLVELLLRWEERPPDEEIERTQRVLRAAALTSQDPLLRQQATDPSFRSLEGVWTQYYVARRSRDPGRRWIAPARLRQLWREVEQDPAVVAAIAEEFRGRIEGGDNPYRVTDRSALRLFLADLGDLLGECVELIATMPRPRATAELVSTHAAAWRDLRDRGALDSVLDELANAEIERQLAGAGLAGAQLAFKLTGWFSALREWREARTADALKRAFRWANVVLGSLGKVVAGLGLDVFKEFKESTEAMLDEAVPPRGYLPAPGFT
jgi:hypothetical protein